MHLFYCNQSLLIEDLFFLVELFHFPYSSPIPIITQIGRENNISAEICPCVRRGGISPPVLSLKI